MAELRAHCGISRGVSQRTHGKRAGSRLQLTRRLQKLALGARIVDERQTRDPGFTQLFVATPRRFEQRVEALAVAKVADDAQRSAAQAWIAEDAAARAKRWVSSLPRV